MAPEELCIVVPLYKEGAALVDLWQSLAPLRAAGVEVILVNAKLPQEQADDTALVAAQQQIPLLHAKKGRARQMNTAASQTQRPWLLFLHADTQLPADVLDQLAALPAATHWGRFDVAIKGRSRGLSMVAFCMNWRSRVTGIATGDQAIFVRRDLFEQQGGFPEQPLMEDIALCRALLKHSRPACVRRKVVTSGRRWDSFGLWRTIFLMWYLRFAYWRGARPDQLAGLYK